MVRNIDFMVRGARMTTAERAGKWHAPGFLPSVIWTTTTSLSREVMPPVALYPQRTRRKHSLNTCHKVDLQSWNQTSIIILSCTWLLHMPQTLHRIILSIGDKQLLSFLDVFGGYEPSNIGVMEFILLSISKGTPWKNGKNLGITAG